MGEKISLFLNTVLFCIKICYILSFFLYYLFISQIPKLKNFIYKRNKKRKIILLFYLCLYIHMNFWLGILEIWEIILSLPAKKHCRLLHPVVLHHTYQSNGISSASISNVCCSRSLAVAASLAAMSAFCAAAFAASAAAFAATAASSAFFESSFFSSFSSS